jgi:predicted dehydrogenase
MIKIGIIGAGGMGNAQARAFGKIKGCAVVAVCDVDVVKARKLAMEHSVGRTFDDVDTFLKYGNVDAVTNVTPDNLHKEVALKVLASGKHILSEKPLATNYPDAAEMARAAESAGVINMVNFSYRGSSGLQHARELVADDVIGEVKHVDATYFQSWLAANMWGEWRTSPGWLWRLSTQHGSQGALGDIGVHILDFAGYPVGDYASVQCRLKAFEKAKNNRIDDYTLDANDSALVIAEFENGALGTIQATRWATGYQNRLALHIFGDKGAIRLNLDEGWDVVEISQNDDIHTPAWETITCKPTPNNYERFITSIRTGVNDQPDFKRGAAIQKVLDACFESDRVGKAVTCL